MHEISLVRTFFKTLEDEFPGETGNIRSIQLTAGLLSNVQPILMQNAFNAVLQEEPRYQKTSLQVEVLPILIRCQECGQRHFTNEQFFALHYIAAGFAATAKSNYLYFAKNHVLSLQKHFADSFYGCSGPARHPVVKSLSLMPMERKELQPRYDVVIIGSGIGGLTAGALLSKAGLSVCVLEKEPHPGGYLAGFRRKDFRFDTAIHWLNQYSKEGMVCKLFDALGNDYPKAISQQRIRRFKGDDYEYLLTNNPDDLKEQWKKEFPEDAEGIERFFKAAKKVGEAFRDFGHIFRAEETMNFVEKMRKKKNMMKFALKFIPHLRFSGDKGIKKGLNKYFKSKKLQEVFSADTEILSCIVPIGWAYHNDFQSPPHGGGQVIAEWLEHIIQFYNQETHYRFEVTKILTKGDKACGVVCSRFGKEYTIESKYVIAASDAPTLYNKLLPEALIPAKLKKNLAKAELYSSSVTISIALDCPVEELGFNEELIHVSSSAVPRSEQAGGDPLRTEICILAPSFRDKSLAPEGNGTLLLFMPADMKYEKEWRTEKDEQGNFIRGKAYKELKESIAQQLIQRVEEKVAPGLQKHILFYEVATPVTHWRYTGNTGGSMMATKPNRPNMMNKVATYRTPVKNLLVGGHWAELGGGVPIAVKAGANAAMLILKEENAAAYKAFANYIDGRTDLTVFHQSDAFKPYSNNWVQKPTPAQKKKLRMAASGAVDSIDDNDEEDQDN